MAKKKQGIYYRALSTAAVYVSWGRVELSSASQEDLQRLYEEGHTQLVAIAGQAETDETSDEASNTTGSEAVAE